MVNRAAILKIQGLFEAKRVPMYHSIFSAAKTGQHAGQWGHVFDADDKEDARYEADSERRQGQHVKVFTVPKDSARWHERDVHHYVTQRIAGKKHDEIEKKPKTTNEAKTDPNLTWSPFKHFDSWKKNAEHRGFVVHQHPNPGGKMTPYFSAKDKEGNHRGHFDDHTKKGELAEQTLSELSNKTLASYMGKAADQRDHWIKKARRHDELRRQGKTAGTTLGNQYRKFASKRQIGMELAARKLTDKYHPSTFTEAKQESPVNIVKNNVNSDHVSRSKDGHVLVRKGFFYSHGGNSQKHADDISGQLTKAGVKHKVVDHGEKWAPFKGGASMANSSHWWVKLKVGE